MSCPAYCTDRDVRTRLAGYPRSGVNIDTDDRMMGGIEYAQSVIDARLGVLYAVPFAPVPAIVKHIASDLAAAFCLDGAMSDGGEDKATSLSVILRSRAMDLLDQLASGVLTIEGASFVDSGIIPYHSALGQRPSLQGFDLYNEPERHLR